MARLDPAAIDLNLLRPLAALLSERHVTHAAVRCGMSQPAMSRALERLRVVLSDELLVRRDGLYELTGRAEALRVELDRLLPQIDATIRGDAFDPAKSHTRFRVVTHEYGGMVLLPGIVRRVTALAPYTIIDVTAWQRTALAEIEAGALDLAIIGLNVTGAALERAPLISDDVVCVVADDHPLRGPACTLAQYVKYSHVAIAVDQGQPWIERPLLDKGFTRRVAYRTPSLAAAALALPGTEMILTIGRRWFDRCAPALPLRVLQAPAEIHPFIYGMAWHVRLSDHPPHVWFRRIVQEVARDVAEATQCTARAWEPVETGGVPSETA